MSAAAHTRYNIAPMRQSFQSFGNPGSHLEMYKRDHPREFLIADKAELKKYFSKINQLFLQNLLQKKIKESMGIDIPHQHLDDIEKLQIQQLDLMPRGYTSLWNEMMIKESVRIFERNLRMKDRQIQKHLRGHVNKKFPHPQVSSTTGEKSTDIDYVGAFIKRGYAKPVRRSRRHQMLTFLEQQGKDFSYEQIGAGRAKRDDTRLI